MHGRSMHETSLGFGRKCGGHAVKMPSA